RAAGSRRGRPRQLGALAALDREREARAHRDGAAGVLGQLGRDRLVADHRVAPLVERDQLRKELRAVAVRVAEDRVDADVLAHRGPPVGSTGARRAAEQRPPRWSSISRSKTRSALSANLSAPSGCAHAPRRAICAASRGSRSRAERASRRPAAIDSNASATAGSPKTQGPHWPALSPAR